MREQCIKMIKSKQKINITNNLDNFNKKFDLITMYHVLEHVPHQIDTLKNIHSKLKKKVKVIIEVPTAEELMQITASVGLAQNYGALRSLITSGIQKGHMKMHLINILNSLEASESEKKLAIEYFKNEIVSNSNVQNYLIKLRKSDEV